MDVSLWDKSWEVEHTPSLPSHGPEVTGWDTGCWLLKEAALGPYSCDTMDPGLFLLCAAHPATA